MFFHPITISLDGIWMLCARCASAAAVKYRQADRSPSPIAYNSSYLPISLSIGRAMRYMGLAANMEKQINSAP
jgi:hypothetical protein